jgi:superfamily II DNA or RNA helicase
MVSSKLLLLKDRYQNGKDDIGKDLIEPCLSECTHYRRGTGFFSSSALKAYASAMSHVIGNKVKIDILCSPVIQDKSLIKILEKNSTPEKRRKSILQLAESVIFMAVGFGLSPERHDYRTKLLAYLIAKGQLEIRFAIPQDFDFPDDPLDDRNIYHVKHGYFELPEGALVAFDGSFNESHSGHTKHVDRAQVYRSWVAEDKGRLLGVKEDIDNDWNKNNPFIDILELSEDALIKIRSVSPKERPMPTGVAEIYKPIEIVSQKVNPLTQLWKHQVIAAETFFKREKGILEMATGTGKTRTALAILQHLFNNKEITLSIISTEGNDLLEQWSKQVKEINLKNGNNFMLYEHYGKDKRSINDFILNRKFKQSVLIISNSFLPIALKNLEVTEKEKLLLVHDEVHKIGSESNRKNLTGLNEGIKWILGLSATPDREYDDLGNQFIKNYIGETIFEFSLESAIKENILCPFNYYPIKYSPSKVDRDKISAVFARKSASDRGGIPMSDKELYIAISKVYKLSEEKLKPFDKFIHDNRDLLRRSIIFVEEKIYGEKVINLVHKYRADFHTYYAEDEQETLKRFASSGDLECLITCHKLSEGIDIKSLSTVILFSSAKAKLETIQRIGRCLRVDPNNKNKIANVIDFIRDDAQANDADIERSDWLSKISLLRSEV